MKRRTLVGLLAVVLFTTLVVSCATFKDTTYKTIYTAGVTYDTAMKTASALHKQGVINDTQWVEVQKYATIYYVAYQASVDAFEVYMKTETVESKDKLVAILNETSVKLGNLIGYLNTIQGVIK
jgi:hypothetical protein